MLVLNHKGKATRVRDVIDVGDAIETFVPFAKRFGWLTRRLAGFVTSTLGAVAASLLPTPISNHSSEAVAVPVAGESPALRSHEADGRRRETTTRPWSWFWRTAHATESTRRFPRAQRFE